MKKQFCVAMMVVAAAVVLLTAGMTTAASYPDLRGTWSGVVSFAGYNGSFFFTDFLFDYEIQNQDFATGNFYGLESGFYACTGNVATNKIVTIIVYGAAGEYRIITGKVSRNKMTGTMQHFKPDQVDTGTFTFYKQ